MTSHVWTRLIFALLSVIFVFICAIAKFALLLFIMSRGCFPGRGGRPPFVADSWAVNQRSDLPKVIIFVLFFLGKVYHSAV